MPKPTLIFTGTKKFGLQLENTLSRKFPNSIVKFLSADHEMKERKDWINSFIDGNVDILISTTILAWGVNLPARHVIISQTAFGLQPMPVCDIQQMMGRAGRPRFDTEGDAYVLLEEQDFAYDKDRIESGEDTISLFSQCDVLQFHGMAEITNGNVKDFLDFDVWHSRSLANLQNISAANAEQVISELKRFNCVKFEDGIIKPRVLGNISTWFYYPPRVVYQFDLNLRRFGEYIESDEIIQSNYTHAKYRVGDIALSMCLNYMVNLKSFVPRDRADEVEDFKSLVFHACPNFFDASKTHGSYVDALDMLNRLSGRKAKVIADFGRLSKTVSTISNMSVHQNRDAVFSIFEMRYIYGAPKELVNLLRIKGVGKVMAKTLFDGGIKTVADVLRKTNEDKILKLINSRKKLDSLLKNAKEHQNQSDSK